MRRRELLLVTLGALVAWPATAAAYDPTGDNTWTPGTVGTGIGVAPAETPVATPIATTTPNALVSPAALPPVPSGTPTPIAGPPDQRALARVNYYRALERVMPLSIDPAVERGASAHVSYYVLNQGNQTMAGMGLHDEVQGNPGFTGVDSDARAKAAGANDWYVDENVGLAGEPEATVDWFVNTVNHRLNLLHPSAVHLGYAASANPPIDVFDIGFSGDRPAVALPSVYPADGQPGVPTSADLQETPDPAPGAPRPLGYPITISFHVQDEVSFASSQLADPSGQPLQLYTLEKKWLRSLALIPARPLQPGQTYVVQVSGMANGQPFSKSWSFTTGAT
jgi:uncharacterized protein YkwD